MKNKKNNELVFLPHLFSLAQSFVAPVGIIGTLISYLVGENELKKHSKNALNWQISLLVYSIISAVLVFVLIGLLFFAVLWLLNTIFSIMALVKSSNEELWEYPLTIRFIK